MTSSSVLIPDVEREYGAKVAAAMLGCGRRVDLAVSNQVIYTGLVPAAVPGVGDLTFEVGFMSAAGLYALLRPALDRSRPTELVDAAA